MDNSLWKLLKKFKRYPTLGSKVIDLLSRYFGRVGGIARPDIVIVEYQFHATPWKTTYKNSSKN